MKHIIWSNSYETIEALEKDILENKEDFPLVDKECSWSYASDLNDDYLSDERANLYKELGNNIVIIADLGLWNGRRRGWNVTSNCNLCSIFDNTCGEYVTWYVEDGEIKCDDVHHDGTNHYTYRILKDGISEWEFEELMAEGKDIEKYTEKIGHYVSEIYGWTE